MRRAFLVACVAAALAAAASCADTDGHDAPPPTTTADAQTPPVFGDGGSTEAAPNDGAAEGGPRTCSAAGWCVTPLPDTDLVMTDLWPVTGRAFAIAQSPTLGVKILVFDDATPKWQYIDDDSQNAAFGTDSYVGNIWAPNTDEVYFTTSPGLLYHGKSAGSTWTWDHVSLPDHGHATETLKWPFPVVGVFGTAADDVYAWYANTIFHYESADGGAPGWVAKSIASDVEDPTEGIYITSASGSKDEIWFSGTRDRSNFYACPLAVRRTAAGYQRVVDGIAQFDPSNPCLQRPGFAWLAEDGWLREIQPLASGGALGLTGGHKIFPPGPTFGRIVTTSDGGFTASAELVDVGYTLSTEYALSSLWISDGEAWLGAQSVVYHGPSAVDAGPLGISTIALTGAPLDTSILRVRGTSNMNLWAIGARYALHKTTP